MPKKTHEYAHASHWNTLLRQEFSKETDRAAVILAASLFDNALCQLLRISLVASPSSTDERLDGANAPLSTFSSRINACYRFGLISKTFCRDLHLIRGIRNQFAHNVSGCSFEDGSVRSRIMELSKSSRIMEKAPKIRESFPEGTRGDFLITASWMLYVLNTRCETAHRVQDAEVEWGYSDSIWDDEEEDEGKKGSGET